MSSVEKIMQKADLGPDFSWSFGNGIFQVNDHAEGESIRFTEKEVVDLIAQSVAGEQDVTNYDLCLASNVFANREESGLAWFLSHQFP